MASCSCGSVRCASSQQLLSSHHAQPVMCPVASRQATSQVAHCRYAGQGPLLLVSLPLPCCCCCCCSPPGGAAAPPLGTARPAPAAPLAAWGPLARPAALAARALAAMAPAGRLALALGLAAALARAPAAAPALGRRLAALAAPAPRALAAASPLGGAAGGPPVGPAPVPRSRLAGCSPRGATPATRVLVASARYWFMVGIGWWESSFLGNFSAVHCWFFVHLSCVSTIVGRLRRMR